MVAEGKKLVVIPVPPPTKRRAERVARYYGRTITYFIERAAPAFEEGMLERLPDDTCRKLYLARKLTLERAFPDRKERKRGWKFPDPPAGDHVAISVNLTPKAILQFARYRALVGVPTSIVVARLFKNQERGILEKLNSEEQALYLAGQYERPIPPLKIDPLGEDEDD
jgi:hypothetical protein